MRQKVISYKKEISLKRKNILLKSILFNYLYITLLY